MKTTVKKRAKSAPRKPVRTAHKSAKTSNAAVIIRQMGNDWAQHWNAGILDKVHGGRYTVNASGYRTSDFRQSGGPSARLVIDVGNWDNSRAVNHPGQSGDPDSRNVRLSSPSPHFSSKV